MPVRKQTDNDKWSWGAIPSVHKLFCSTTAQWQRDEEAFSGEAAPMSVVHLFWDRAATWSPGCLQTHGPVSASGIPGLQTARRAHFEDRCLEMFWSSSDSVSSNSVYDIFKTQNLLPAMVVLACNPSIWETEAEGSGMWCHPWGCSRPTWQVLSPQHEQNQNKSLRHT